MNLTHAAATTLVPLLVRATLAAVMVPTGWTMLTERIAAPEPLASLNTTAPGPEAGAEATGESSTTSESDGASRPPAAESPSSDADRNDAAPSVEAATPPGGDDAPGATPAADSTARPGTSETPGEPEVESDREPAAEAEAATRRRLHEYAMVFERAGWPAPSVLAWTLALSQVVGGGMLLLGLATRLWGLVFAVASVAFFSIDSWPVVQSTLGIGLSWADWTLVTSQAGLAILSTILLLTGGGAVSIDRGLFRPRPPASPVTAASTE